ncbi:MAG: HAD family hydrolase [Candidatus Hydrothermales bacterium]
MPIKVITFDYWDTLVPIEENKIELMRKERAKKIQEFFNKKGRKFSYDEIYKTSKRVWELYKENPLINKEVTLYIMVEKILEHLSIEKKEDIVKEIVQIYEEYLYKAGLKVDSEVIDVIKELKSENFKLGIVSNTPGGNVERKILEDYGIDKFFDIMVFSSIEGIRKPHPEIFLKVVNFFNIEPGELLHIGDTFELDIEGPLKIGAKAILWDPKKKNLNPDIKSINSWNELKKIINQYA